MMGMVPIRPESARLAETNVEAYDGRHDPHVAHA
jgi:hypothetical protein